MERFVNRISADALLGPARKLGMAAAAAMMLVPIQAAAQIGPGPYTCDSGITLDAQGQQPFFVQERIPIVLTMEAEVVSDGSANGVLHIEEFDFKPDCQAGTDFNTCVSAGNTVVIATPDSAIGGSCGVSYTTANLDAETIQFTPSQDIVLAPQETCTVEFDVVVVSAPTGTPTVTEIGGWAESQVSCYTTGNPPVAYPEAASSAASSSISFQISTERAEFVVEKIFADQSATETADVYIQCNGGLPLEQNYTLDHMGRVRFVVREFAPGTLDCTIWEDPIPAGYTAAYTAGEFGGIAGSIGSDASGCQFTQVETGLFSCDIINEVDQVDVTVNKQWTVDLNDAPFLLQAEANYVCFDVFTSPDGSGGAENITGTMSFSGESDSNVITGLYPASSNSYCTVTEVNVPEEWVLADDSDCERVPVLDGAECTIFNSAFFEGIPTLNQYGMALMVLLMLGIGAVGFRRFA